MRKRRRGFGVLVRIAKHYRCRWETVEVAGQAGVGERVLGQRQQHRQRRGHFQVLGQHGYIGLGLYLLFWILTYRTAGRIMEKTRQRPDWEWAWQLAAMMKVSIVGFAVGGAFLSLAFWDMPFYFMVILVATEKWVNSRLHEEAGVGVAHSGVRQSLRQAEISS